MEQTMGDTKLCCPNEIIKELGKKDLGATYSIRVPPNHWAACCYFLCSLGLSASKPVEIISQDTKLTLELLDEAMRSFHGEISFGYVVGFLQRCQKNSRTPMANLSFIYFVNRIPTQHDEIIFKVVLFDHFAFSHQLSREMSS